MSRLQDQYRDEVVKKLQEQFSYKNLMEVPRITKITLNMGVGEAIGDRKVMDNAVSDMEKIAGQKPIVCKARKSVANFKLREGRAIGVKVTLRGEKMWAFLSRLINVALPRTRDFRGVPDKLDGRGNYTLGLREQLLFQEINYDKIDRIRGFEVTINTTAETDEEARRLLEMLGMPFQR